MRKKRALVKSDRETSTQREVRKGVRWEIREGAHFAETYGKKF